MASANCRAVVNLNQSYLVHHLSLHVCQEDLAALITASAEGFDDIVGKLIKKGAEIDAITSVRNGVALNDVCMHSTEYRKLRMKHRRS